MTQAFSSVARRTGHLSKTGTDSPLSSMNKVLALACLPMATMVPMAARAVDVDIGDFVPAPEGTTVGLLYLQHAERDKLYAQGQQTVRAPRLVSDVGIARLVHYTTLGGLTVGPQILVPFGQLDAGRDTSSLGKTSGVGDVILAAPVWLINDSASRTYLAIAPYLYLPTGSYSHDSQINLGENR